MSEPVFDTETGLSECKVIGRLEFPAEAFSKNGIAVALIRVFDESSRRRVRVLSLHQPIDTVTSIGAAEVFPPAGDPELALEAVGEWMIRACNEKGLMAHHLLGTKPVPAGYVTGAMCIVERKPGSQEGVCPI